MDNDRKHLDIKRLKLLITEEKTGYVFEYLANYLQDSGTGLFNELVLLYTEYNKLQRNINNKLIEREAARIEHNQLINRVLNLLDQLDVRHDGKDVPAGKMPTVPGLENYSRIKEEETQESSFTGLTIGNYRIGEYIASGGFGRVHKAVDFMTDEVVAIKVSKPLNVSEIYLNDMVSFGKKILKLPDHPHIARTHFIGHGTLQGEDRIYYAMDYVEGGDLHEITGKSFEEISISERLRIFRQICEGVDFAHRTTFINSFGNRETGIIHGDIKPANVLLTNDLEAKVSDFLLVDFYLIMEEDREIKNKVMNRNPPTTIVGTKAYMAPEQLTTGHISVKTDIYALGVLLFELLTARKINFTTSKDYIEDQITKLHSNKEELILKIIRTCLALKPADRYNDVGEILAEISSAEKPRSLFRKIFGR